MQGTRTENALKNSFAGMINKLVNIVMPFVTRTVIIYVLGMEYAGLNSLFSSILQVLNLAELGISSAVVYCMYKPMAEGNKEVVCALLNYMRKLYYVIGFIVSGLGLGLIPFLNIFIKGTVPNGLSINDMYIIYLLNVGIGYFFFSYKSTLLNADQKMGIISNINTGINFFQCLAQIIAVGIFKNYYAYLIMMPIFTVINNIFIQHVTQKYYPDICCKGDLDNENKKDISMRVKGLFVTRICTSTRNAFDSIFISSFVGLSVVAKYGNYYYIMSAIISILSVITNSMTAGVGNSIVTESIEKNYNDFRKFNFIFNWLVGFCTCCLLTLYQPFMKVWMGETALFPFPVVVLFCIYFYFLNLGSIRAVYHDSAGLWWEARHRAVIEAFVNLTLNFLLTRRLGVFGTILGTLISLIIINYVWGAQIVFKYYFKTITIKQYYKDNMIYTFTTFIGCAVTYFMVNQFESTGTMIIILSIIVDFLIFNGIYYVFMFKTQIFADSVELVRTISENMISYKDYYKNKNGRKFE